MLSTDRMTNTAIVKPFCTKIALPVNTDTHMECSNKSRVQRILKDHKAHMVAEGEGQLHLGKMKRLLSLTNPQCYQFEVSETRLNYCLRQIRDLECIARNYRHLSECSFYYPDFGMQEASERLAKCRTGTFLLRNSSSVEFLFTISIKTRKGVTSVRICWTDCMFRLECEEGIDKNISLRENVLELIQHYVSSGKSTDSLVFSSKRNNTSTTVSMKYPYEEQPCSLSQLCRRTINHHLQRRDPSQLSLTRQSLSYLQQYPFSI